MTIKLQKGVISGVTYQPSTVTQFLSVTTVTFKQSGEPTTPLTSDLTLQLLNSNDHHLRNKCLDWILILICTYLLQLRTGCLTSEDHVFLPTHQVSRCKQLLFLIS